MRRTFVSLLGKSRSHSLFQAAKPLVFPKFSYSSNSTSFQHLLLSKEGSVAVVQLNRAKALNALCKDLCSELGSCVEQLEKDDSVRAIVITGSEKAFAAGADIKEMKDMSFTEVNKSNLFGELDAIARAKKPIIAAVNGFALGGGCELAMMCDIIIASDKAKFGQPEIKLGTVPGIGGTQRLTKLIGKQKAMEWVLTGELYSAQEAEHAGLVARTVPSEQLMTVALSTAQKIAQFSQPIVKFAKELVQKADELPLAEGLNLEKHTFQSTFATADQKEGMSAFVEKRKANFSDK